MTGWRAMGRHVGVVIGLMLASVHSLACGDIGAVYDYHGAYQVAPGRFRVRSVFSLPDSPVALVTSANGDGGDVLGLIRVTTGAYCQTGPLGGYVAALDQRGLRLGVLHGETGLQFYDDTCELVDLPLPEVVTLDLAVRNDLYVFVAQAQNGDRLVVDPYGRSQRLLARAIAQAVSSSLAVPNTPGRGTWLLGQDGGIVLQGLTGPSLSLPVPRATGLVVQTAPDWDGVASEYLVLQTQEGMALYRVAATAGGLEVELKWNLQDVCDGRLFVLPTSCSGLECATGQRSDDPVAGPTPLVALRQPCNSSDLSLVTEAGEVAGRWPMAADDYLILPGSDSIAARLLYSRATDDGAQTWAVRLRGAGRVVEGAIREPVPLQIGSIQPAQDDSGYTALSAEPTPRYGNWRPDGGFEGLLERASRSDFGLVMHDMDGDYGRLSHCDHSGCRQLGAGVPAGGYRRYRTVPRFEDGEPAVAFLRDYDGASKSGTLVVYLHQAQVLVELADHVSSYAPVETGAVRGIAYTTVKEQQEGLWFAPR